MQKRDPIKTPLPGGSGKEKNMGVVVGGDGINLLIIHRQ